MNISFQENLFLRLLNLLCGWRVDCRFAPGVAKAFMPYGADSSAELAWPAWMKADKDRDGRCIRGCRASDGFTFACEKDGVVTLELRNIMVPAKTGKKRLPFYADYVSVKVRGVNLLKGCSSAWHDGPTRLAFPVKAGETVVVEIGTKAHVYEKETLLSLLRQADLPSLKGVSSLEDLLGSAPLQGFLVNEREQTLTKALQESRDGRHKDVAFLKGKIQKLEARLKEQQAALEASVEDRRRDVAFLKDKIQKVESRLVEQHEALESSIEGRRKDVTFLKEKMQRLETDNDGLEAQIERAQRREQAEWPAWSRLNNEREQLRRKLHPVGTVSPSAWERTLRHCRKTPLACIRSERFAGRHMPWWDVVFEWEDDLASALRVPLAKTGEPPVKGLDFAYVMVPNLDASKACPAEVVCLIDFYLRDPEEIKKFSAAYAKCRSVCVSSREVYEFLKSVGCPLPLRHLALSLSDRYLPSPETRFEKRYDLALLGRPNPVLQEYVERYAAAHSDFRYVKRVLTNKISTFDLHTRYETNDGVRFTGGNGREEYLSLMRASRVGLYSTPGMDEDPETSRAHGFNQVTPRFLEMLSCGCQVLARYPKNPDTDYYELDRMAKRIETYGDFEAAMDFARTHEADMAAHSAYLAKHTTSARARELVQLLNEKGVWS